MELLLIAFRNILADVGLAVKEETEQYIPAWEGLLQVYGGLFLPVIFALLFELNLAAYVANRINYSVRHLGCLAESRRRLMRTVRHGAKSAGIGL